jgi:UDP-N-acetylmuramyl pentapeptide phosphotransferase/UDP-N-acetylglucosamine-1-phosphate transferase
MLAYRYSCLLAFLIGLAVTYLLTPRVRSLALRLGAVDMPNERRPHKRPTPRGGGLAVVLGVQSAYLIALALSARQADWLNFGDWAAFARASLVLLVIGILDDVRGLRPLVKLGGQVTAALIVWLSGTHFGTLFGHPLPASVDCFLVVLWLVAVINAFNLIDGLDGLASGLAIISAVGLCGIITMGHLSGDVLMLAALIGACFGFLRYNFHPASIFLGDTGSMFLGFTLGVVSLRTLTKSTFILSLAIPFMVLGVPIYDEVLAVWRRSVRRWLARAANSPAQQSSLMQADLEHLHHRLLNAGFSTRHVGILLFLLNAALVVVGLLITAFQSRAMGIFLLGLLALVYVLLRHLAVIELRDTGTVLLAGLRRPTHATARALGLPIWDMLCLAGAAALTVALLEPPQPNFWRNWFLDLPLWVTPTFSLLALSRLYLTVWSRARTRDLLTLIGILLGGLLLSLGILLVIDPGHPAQCLAKALLIGCLSFPAILAVRITYRSVEELVGFFRHNSEPTPRADRVVLYGAGAHCELFLKERAFRADGREIVGLLDDECSLHDQWVYGYPVLGGIASLPQLIARHHFSGIIITADLAAHARQNLYQLARRHNLRLTEWRFGEAELLPAELSESSGTASDAAGTRSAVVPVAVTPV